MEFSKCSSDEMSPLQLFSWRCRWKHIGEITFIGEISTDSPCGPCCFPLVHWMNSWFLMVHCFSSNHLKILKISSEFLVRPRITYSFLSQKFNSASWPSPFKSTVQITNSIKAFRHVLPFLFWMDYSTLTTLIMVIQQLITREELHVWYRIANYTWLGASIAVIQVCWSGRCRARSVSKAKGLSHEMDYAFYLNY